MFCSKCGSKLPDDARFCGECGTPVEDAPQTKASAADAAPTPPPAPTPAPSNTAPAAPTTPSSSIPSASPAPSPAGSSFQLPPPAKRFLIVGACMIAAALIYLVFIMGRLTIGGVMLYLAAPVVFAVLVFTKGKENPILYVAPLGLAALGGLIMFIQFPGSSRTLLYLVHIALAVIFFLTVNGKLPNRDPLLGTSAGAAVLFFLMGFNSGLFYALMQLLYFGAVALMVLDLEVGSSSLADMFFKAVEKKTASAAATSASTEKSAPTPPPAEPAAPTPPPVAPATTEAPATPPEPPADTQ